MKPRYVTQVKLETKNNEQMTTWLDADDAIKIGVIIELKNDGRLWRIKEVYDTLEASKIDTHGWDNNDYSIHRGLWT